MTERWLTVCGEVARPMVTRVPIGVSLAEVIEAAGGTTLSDYQVVVGGPMMGAVAADLAAPVTKTTSGIIVLPVGHNVVSGQGARPGPGHQDRARGLLPVLALH